MSKQLKRKMLASASLSTAAPTTVKASAETTTAATATVPAAALAAGDVLPLLIACCC